MIHNKEFFLKFTMRLFHMYGVLVMGGIIITENIVFPNTSDSPNNNKKIMLISSIITLFLGGFINIFLLKDFKEKCSKEDYRRWAMLVHLKLVLTIVIFFPILDLFMNEKALKVLRVSSIFIFLVLAVYTK